VASLSRFQYVVVEGVGLELQEEGQLSESVRSIVGSRREHTLLDSLLHIMELVRKRVEEPLASLLPLVVVHTMVQHMAWVVVEEVVVVEEHMEEHMEVVVVVVVEEERMVEHMVVVVEEEVVEEEHMVAHMA